MHSKTIDVLPHDPEWIKIFEREREKISKALKDNLTEIHHVGSTCIEGLVAKPKIDISAYVENPYAIVEPLKTIDYEFRGEWNIPLKAGFSNREGFSINLHIHPKGHGALQMHVAFRDYLRAHPNARDAYGKLKLQLLENKGAHAKQRQMFSGYALQKNEFIKEVYQTIGIKAFWASYAIHDAEYTLLKQLGLHTGPDHGFIIFYEGPKPMALVQYFNGTLETTEPYFIENAIGLREKINQFLEQWRDYQVFLKQFNLEVGQDYRF